MKKYTIYDSTGTIVATLTTMKDALDFKHIRGNNTWTIKIIEPLRNIQATARQKGAIKFVEEWLNITLTGNINDFYEVSDFLSEYLDEAKQMYDEAYSEYSSYVWSKYFE